MMDETESGCADNAQKTKYAAEKPIPGTKTRNDHTVPRGFTLSMTLIDALPVLLFCGGSCIVASKFGSALFWAGAVACIAAGSGKVLWKIGIAVLKKNIWPLNRQMRYLMPLGFAGMLVAVLLALPKISFLALWHAVSTMPAALLFMLGGAGMVCMAVYAKILDGTSARANWLEQITNTAAQLAIFLGVLFAAGIL